MEEIQNAIGETWASPWGKILIIGGAGVAVIAAYMAYRNGGSSAVSPSSSDYFPGNYPFSAAGGGGGGYSQGAVTDPYANAQKEVDLQKQISDLMYTDALRRGEAQISLTQQLQDIQLSGMERQLNADLFKQGQEATLAYNTDRAYRQAAEWDRLSDFNFLFGDTTSISGGNTGGGILSPGVNTPAPTLFSEVAARGREGQKTLSTGTKTASNVSSFYRGTGSNNQGFGDDAAFNYGNIRTVGQDTAPQFVQAAPQNRADYLYNYSQRATVDAYNMANKNTGYAVDIQEYLQRREGQEQRDTIRQQQSGNKSFSISTPWGGLSYGAGGGNTQVAVQQPPRQQTPPIVRTPSTFPTLGGWNWNIGGTYNV